MSTLQRWRGQPGLRATHAQPRRQRGSFQHHKATCAVRGRPKKTLLVRTRRTAHAGSQLHYNLSCKPRPLAVRDAVVRQHFLTRPHLHVSSIVNTTTVVTSVGHKITQRQLRGSGDRDRDRQAAVNRNHFYDNWRHRRRGMSHARCHHRPTMTRVPHRCTRDVS